MSFLNNLSFLITFVLFLVMIGLIWYHFNERLNEQNGKISQMVRVLTTMTAEVSLIRKKIGLPFPDTIDINNNHTPDETNTNNKIDVSDDEAESDESDSDSECDTDSETDSDEEIPKVKKEEESKVEINDIDDKIKEEIVENIVEEIINHLEDIDLGIDILDDIEEEKEEKEEEEKEGNEETDQIKEDYKKMSLNKLKSIVLEKKLTTDVKTLKKNDLLSILGVEL